MYIYIYIYIYIYNMYDYRYVCVCVCAWLFMGHMKGGRESETEAKTLRPQVPKPKTAKP